MISPSLLNIHKKIQQIQELEDYFKHSISQVIQLDGEIKGEIIEHPLDIMVHKKLLKFLHQDFRKSYLLNIQIPTIVHTLDIWITMSYGLINQVYPSCIVYFYEIPFLQIPLDLVLEKKQLKFNYGNKKIEKNLNRDKSLIKSLNKYFVFDTEIYGYKLKLQNYLDTVNIEDKTFLVISNLPGFDKKKNLILHELETIELINGIVKHFI